MTEFQVMPIFNQSAPGIWDDFLRIRLETMIYNYNLPMSLPEIQRAQQEYMRDWGRYGCNYAFGAYDSSGRMIGCINGYVLNGVGYVNHLYVLPEYQGQHIGRILLGNAERAVSATKGRRIELVSLLGAEKFYQSNGYQDMSGCKYLKKLSLPRCATVPVFWCRPDLAVRCNISPDTVKQINTNHTPVFIYYNHESKILGHAIIYSPENIQVSLATGSFDKKLVQRNLERAAHRYISHLRSQQTR